MTTNRPLPIFDTHAHLDLEQFDADRPALVRRLESGTFPGGIVPDERIGQPIEIVGVIVPGIDAASCRKTLETASLSDRFHAAIAVHPNHTVGITEEDWRTIAELVHQKEVVAVGETGLDRYWDDAPIEIQIASFRRHIEFSQQTGKPILIHCRDAWKEMLPILQAEKKLNGVIHAFSGSVVEMSACVELGLMISFAGSVTYRNTKFSPLWEAAQMVPADRLLIETDSPFMTPHPLRGKLSRNEPALAALTALRLAELRKESLQTIAETTAQNAFRIFCNTSAGNT